MLFFLFFNDGYCLYKLCITLGTNEFLGATVITNMITVIPVGGKFVMHWIWGGYTIKNPTLHRIYSLHFILPFLIAGLTFIHLTLLHKVGSTSPLGSDNGIDDVPFYPYYVSKDLFALSCFLVVFATFVLYFPNTLNHPDNYIPADPIHTPAHVVPEWYFLPFYAILRSIPHKTAGILSMFSAILVLFTLPSFNTSIIRNTTFRPIFKFFFWSFIADIIILAWLGQKPVKEYFYFSGPNRYCIIF